MGNLIKKEFIMTMKNKQGFTSSQIAKERLKSLQSETRQTYTGETSGYVSNQVEIDNNMFWEKDHNILSSKGD